VSLLIKISRKIWHKNLKRASQDKDKAAQQRVSGSTESIAESEIGGEEKERKIEGRGD